VHDNTNGDFLAVDTSGVDNPCEACHNATPAIANSWGDHTTAAGGNHQMTVGTFECNQCHTVHGATAQTNQIGTLTAPILLADNNTTYYGDFCISCHSGTAPTGGTVGAGGVAASDQFNYAEVNNDGTELKHPTINTTGWAGTGVGGCNKCHDVHNPGSTTTHLLLASNIDSAYCMSCHDGASAPGTTGGGGGSHYTGIPTNVSMNTLTAGNALPWADQIDDDGNVGDDYVGATANMMVCETCHSAHRAGADGYFLRNVNGATNAICSRCHVDN
jgi:predicted CXXCH cytochrome family protein